MEIKINLDETRFKDLVDSELGKFTSEEIHDILQQAIGQYIVDNDVIGRIFYTKKKDWSGKETGEVEPTYVLKDAIKTIDIEPTIEKLKEQIKEVLNKDETVHTLAENIFYRFISDRIRQLIWNDDTLASLIQVHANNVLDNRLNNQH